ncbi:MAG: hypothetical protein D3913_16340, partial [Candidatus Electrothrix sp. LOE1_4_5]|nr:hypothetical protein [Candidatus Electrothrix gigas]
HTANKHGYHAGHRFHRDHLGIEIMGSGKLIKKGYKYFTWFGKEIPSDEVRWFDGGTNQKEGYYHKFSEAQEKSLIDLVMWLNAAYDSFSIDNVVGHDEIRAAKNDPGGSLSMSMTDFRVKLYREWDKRGGAYS